MFQSVLFRNVYNNAYFNNSYLTNQCHQYIICSIYQYENTQTRYTVFDVWVLLMHTREHTLPCTHCNLDIHNGIALVAQHIELNFTYCLYAHPLLQNKLGFTVYSENYMYIKHSVVIEGLIHCTPAIYRR